MNLTLLILMVQTYITVACDSGPNTIACTLTMLIMQFSQFPFLHNEEWSFSMIFGKLFNAFFCFAILTILSMLVTYIAMIRGKMNKLIVENLNLLDKMHEGLIVLSESDKSI